MARYIDAEKFYEALSLCVTEIEIKLDAETDSSKVLKAVQNGLINFPTVDVAPVVHAHWEYHESVCTGEGRTGVYVCSACKAAVPEAVFDFLMDGFYKDFCGACGARMDEEVKKDGTV